MNMQNSSQGPNSLSTPKSSAFMPIIPIPQISHGGLNGHSIEHQPSKLKETYETYLDLFRKNKHLQIQLNQLQEEKTYLQQKYNSIQVILSSKQTSKSDPETKKKRHRRMANEITRDYICPLDNCGKSYGADAALIQHIKLKHAQFYGSIQYETMIKNLHSRKEKENEHQQN